MKAFEEQETKLKEVEKKEKQNVHPPPTRRRKGVILLAAQLRWLWFKGQSFKSFG